MPDPIRKRSGYGQLWPLRLLGPDRTCRIRFPASVSAPFFLLFFFFSKELRHGSYCAKPTRIRCGWPGQVWPNPSDLEASRCAGIIGPGFWQDATGPLPVFHFQTRLQSSTHVQDDIVQNQPGSDSVLADCVRFWPNGSGSEASRCAKIIRPASGQCLRSDPDRMRIESGMFTGIVFSVKHQVTYLLSLTVTTPVD